MVKCIHTEQLQHEIHVELQRSELCATTSEIYIEKRMREASISLKEPFDVYIQTLISHALDSNFLTEIMENKGTPHIDAHEFHPNCRNNAHINYPFF